MFKIGDIVILKWDDSPNNQNIIGKPLLVVEPPTSLVAPQWMEVLSESGEKYSVRGADCWLIIGVWQMLRSDGLIK